MGQKGSTGYPEEFCLAPFSSALLLPHVMKSQKGIFTKEEDIYLIMLVHNMSSSVLLIGGNSQIKRPIFLGVAACACHHSTREEETRAS